MRTAKRLRARERRKAGRADLVGGLGRPPGEGTTEPAADMQVPLKGSHVGTPQPRDCTDDGILHPGLWSWA